jgi:cytidylate kinase
LREIEARDERDANRKVAPLRPASGALIVDTTGMPVAAVVRKVLDVVRSNG